MKKGLFLLFAGILMFNLNCKEKDCSSTVPFTPGAEFTMQSGNVYSDGSLQIELKSVVEDSRCPSNADCIWAGQVRVDLELILNGSTIARDTLRLGGFEAVNLTDSAVLNNYTVTLLAVDPYPGSFIPIPQDDYRLKMIVTKQ